MAKILVVFYLLFSTCNSLAQAIDKKNFIGIFQNNAFAQKQLVDTYSVPDTLSKAEIAELNAATRHSTFGYFYLADSLSKIGDSINTSNYFLKIDPFYLIFEGQTPNSIDTFIINHFKLTGKSKKTYIKLFIKTFNTPKSRAYTDFKKMADEDQAVRIRQTKCNDSLCFAINDKEIQYTDSVHFSYLYNYIKKNGWPSLSNGSMYASLLAIHDHSHADEYIPIIKSAVLEKQVEMSALHLIVYWHEHDKYFSDIRYYIAVHPYVRFDISNIITDNSLSMTMPEIQKVLQGHCHEKIFYICESKEMKLYLGWIHNLDTIAHRMEHPLAKLNADLVNYTCGLSSDDRAGMADGFWRVDWLPTDHENLKIFLYITFESEEGDLKYQKMLTSKKYISHAVQFEYDSSTIKPESVGFISQLTEWLKQNPSVNLEIDGHTDNEGTTEFNLKLSQARADEVKKQLVSRGIAYKRLTTKGYGDTNPIDRNDTPEGRAKNRRVEFIKL